jgi:hypothetical protein
MLKYITETGWERQEWINLARNRDRSGLLFEELRFKEKAGNFSTIYTTVSFSSRSVLHEVG